MDEKVLIGILVMVLLFGVAAFYIHNNGPPKILDKLPLVEEYNPEEIVVVEQAITPSPGSVWRLEQTPSGLMFKQLDSKLVEELELQNVTLQGGDVISWHGDDFGFYSPNNYTYVQLNLDDPLVDFTVVARAKLEQNVITNAGYEHFIVWMPGAKLRGAGDPQKLYFQMWDTSFNYMTLLDDTNPLDWFTIAGLFDNSTGTARMYVNGNWQTYTTQYYTNIEQTAIKLGAYTASAPLGWYGRIAYAMLYGDYREQIVIDAENHIVNENTMLLDATFYNGTYIDIVSGSGNTAITYGNVQRVPAEQTWLWLIKSVESDTNIHVKYMPPGTILKIKDTVTGQTWEYTVTGVQNAAGLIEDYTIAPPTSNPVDITAYVPSERVRFYAPDGFTIKISDSTGYTTENTITDGKVTLAGGTTVKLVAQDQKQLTLQLDETPTVYRILVSRSDGTPSDTYIWIYDPSGNLVDYGLAENGVYEIAKNPNLPDGIRVEAKALDSGIYYTGSKDFRLAEEQTVTVVPQSGLLSNNNFVIALAAAIFLGMIAIAVIVRGR